MILESDVGLLIAAATQKIGVSIHAPVDAVLNRAVVKVCEQLGRELDPDQAVAAIRDYRFDEAAIQVAERDPDAIAGSIRSQETDHWLRECPFLWSELRAMLQSAQSAGADMPVMCEIGTIYTLVGYAIRVGRGSRAA